MSFQGIDLMNFTLMSPFLRTMETNISSEWSLMNRRLLMTLLLTLLLVTLKTVNYGIANLYWPENKGRYNTLTAKNCDLTRLITFLSLIIQLTQRNDLVQNQILRHWVAYTQNWIQIWCLRQALLGYVSKL